MRALERQGHEPDSPAASQGERRPDGEGREPLQLRLLRAILVEGELERRDRRLAERERVEPPRPQPLRLSVARGERSADVVARVAGLGRTAGEALRCEQGGRRLGLKAPDGRAGGARRLGGEADDVLGRLRLVGARGQRLAEELQRGLGQLSSAVGALARRAIEPHGHGHMGGSCAGERLLPERERLRAEELEGGDD